jgi:hypothetical protein
VKTKPTLPATSQFPIRQTDATAAERTLDVRKETLILGEVGHQDAHSAADHGVLSHEDDTAVTESLTDLVHLLRGDLKREMMSEHDPCCFLFRGRGTYIVDGDNEDGLVVLQQALQLVEVFLLVGLDPHFFLFA